MPTRTPIRRRPHAARAFTLIEVALALGIAGFVLAGLIGAIPLATNVGQQSIVQSRASSIANTIFTNFRAQKFDAEAYLDDGTVVNLDVSNTSTSPLIYYAYFDETVTSAPGGEARRLHFVATNPVGTTNANPVYQVTLHFNNNPSGTLAPYPTTASPTHSEANAIEASVFALGHPKDVFRFSSVIANRAE